MNESADTTLAKRIFEVIRQKKLLPENQLDDLQVKFSEGALTREDWILLAELELETRESREK